MAGRHTIVAPEASDGIGCMTTSILEKKSYTSTSQPLVSNPLLHWNEPPVAPPQARGGVQQRLPPASQPRRRSSLASQRKQGRRRGFPSLARVKAGNRQTGRRSEATATASVRRAEHGSALLADLCSHRRDRGTADPPPSRPKRRRRGLRREWAGARRRGDDSRGGGRDGVLCHRRTAATAAGEKRRWAWRRRQNPQIHANSAGSTTYGHGMAARAMATRRLRCVGDGRRLWRYDRRWRRQGDTRVRSSACGGAFWGGDSSLLGERQGGLRGVVGVVAGARRP